MSNYKIHPETVNFLSELAVHNNKEWFQEHKALWDEIRKEFLNFTEGLINVMQKEDPTLEGLVANKCMYRIYRDLRFSPDKRPYKTHVASFLPSKGLKNCGVPGYYFQVGTFGDDLKMECNLGGGIFMPDAKTLERIRQEIFYNPEEFGEIVNAPAFKKFFPDGFWTLSKLKTAPKGYPKDWVHVDWLRYKDYTTMCDFPIEKVMDEDFFDRVVEGFKASVPLNFFIQKAMWDIL